MAGQVGGVILVVALLVCLHWQSLWQDSVVGRFALYAQTDYPRDLKSYLTHPRIETIRPRQMPQNVVVIMGESYAKAHCSLYGYPLNTCPHLSAMRDSGELSAFENVSSAQLITSRSFKCMLSTYKPEYGDSPHWYECTTIPELFRLMGYETVWISNQIKTGVIDNVVGRYAELFDKNVFINDNFSDKQHLDGDLLPVVQTAVKAADAARRHFWFIHLMGSHMVFKERYPEQFQRFAVDDYRHLKAEQRQLICDYDNSVAYNDSIVSRLMACFEKTDALVVYLSDHGLDLYDSSDDYIGHGREGNAKSEEVGRQIPFMIYSTRAYRQRHPDVQEKIEKSENNHFRTDDLPYALMDVAGGRFADNDDVKKYSLLNNDR